MVMGERKYGAPGRIRTSDPLVRSQILYPTELRALGSLSRTRTCDPMINSHLLYQLSYQGKRLATWSGILKMKVGVVKAKNHLFYP